MTTYKVDDNRKLSRLGTGHEIGAIIAMALSGIGDALNHKSGPGSALSTSMQIIDGQIDKEIEDQRKQKEQLGTDASTVKGAMDDSRRTMSDDRRIAFAQDSRGPRSFRVSRSDPRIRRGDTGTYAQER